MESQQHKDVSLALRYFDLKNGVSSWIFDSYKDYKETTKTKIVDVLFIYELDFAQSAYLADSANVNLASSIQSIKFLPKKMKRYYLEKRLPHLA